MQFNKIEPLYTQIAANMRQKIRTNQWPEKQQIPSEFQLGILYHVSRITIRKAISELKAENLLISRRPNGTFVSAYLETKPDNYTQVKSFTQEMSEMGIAFETLSATIEKSHADKKIVRSINLDSGDDILILKRVRGVHGKPLGYFETYFKFEPKFSLRNSDYYGSFYQYLQQFKIQLKKNTEMVTATLPNRKLSTLLKISPSAPILQRTRLTSDAANNFYEYTECFYVGSEYRYYIDFTH